jgi:alpha-L-fucosidase
MDYQRANTDWLANCRFGIGAHWTAQTVPRNGSALSFQKAVDAFDLRRFVDQFTDAGADYLLFTAAHALQRLPAPHPIIDQILPGRTCRRDLIAELADALAGRGNPLLVYYNHSCNQAQDRAWVHHRVNTEIPKPLYSDQEVVAYVRECNAHKAPMTFNVGIYQDGTMAEASVEQLRRLNVALKFWPVPISGHGPTRPS